MDNFKKRYLFIRKSHNRKYDYDTPDIFLDIVLGFYVERNSKGFNVAQPVHIHPNYEMHIILEGSCRFETESKEIFNLLKGDVIIIPPNTKHKIMSESDCFKKISLSFYMEVKNKQTIDFYAIAQRKLTKSQVYKINEKIKNHIETLTINANKNSRIYSNIIHLAAISIIFELLIIVVGNVKFEVPIKSNDTRITNAIEYIENNISANLDVKDVANHLHISVKHLGRIFKDEMNITPGAYIKNYRMQCVFEMLFNNMHTEDIANIMGYTDTTSLIKAYKRVAGTTPGKFQRSLKN